MTTRTRETEIHLDTEVPLVRITREFDAPAAKVFRAHVDPDLFALWIGPRDVTMTIEHFDCRTGGSYRWCHHTPGFDAWFHGSFHEVRENSLIVQTFTFEGVPDGVALEKITFTELGPDRTGLVTTSLVDSFADRDAFVAGGMESGVVDGYRKLDELLARP